MAKKDISKILVNGSVKQKLKLIAEDNARVIYNKDRILTEAEHNRISDSFSKPNEIKLWNKWLHHGRVIVNAITNLQGLLFEVKMNYSNLRGYILVWNSIENAELLVNSVLHEIKDSEERKRIAANSSKSTDLLFSKAFTDKEGYLDLKIDFEKDSYKGKSYKEEPTKTKEFSLLHVMNNVKKETEDSVIKFKSWSTALQDYMEENNYNIKTYKDILKGFETQLYTPIIGWTKYQGDEKQFISEGKHEALDKLKNIYSITPNVEELKPDPKTVKWFRTNFLDNE
jgi:hypothetical protein